MNVLRHLSNLWSKLESRHSNQDGLTDYVAIRDDDYYWKFEEEICELQKISLRRMDADAKTAFVINCYNLMVKYAFVKVGIPKSNASRRSFFGRVSANVGGHVFSLDDLEHGILRSNARPPYRPSRPFGVADPRRPLASDGFDPRIHFALNCGAKGCPPVKWFTSEALEEELRSAAMAFCEEEGNVAVDASKGEVRLSKLFYWYMYDFGE